MDTATLDSLIAWADHPARMVRDLFGVMPGPWQADVLEAFPHTPQIAMQACVGPGKSCVLAWIGWNFLLTRHHPIVGCASINADNLKSGLWTELSRWYQKSELLQRMFVVQKTEILNRKNPSTWKMEARSWAKDADQVTIGSALRGLHAPHVMWLLDECGNMPPAVLRTCEAIFATDSQEAHIVMAGNPISKEGLLYEAASKARKYWTIIEITADPDDPKRTPRVSLEHARQQIELYGRDDPYVIVNILGKFPPSDINSLIGLDEVRAAQNRFYREYDIGKAARVMGVDVARFGLDSSCIAKRQGVQMFNSKKSRNMDSTQGAGWVTREALDWKADAVFVDDTGGYGAGWGDQMRSLGQTPIMIAFSSKAANDSRYFNKRTEMAFEFVEWIKAGGAIPDSPELTAALTQTTYSFKKDRMILEPKDSVKVKLGYSPDEMDAGMLTFAHPVSPNVDRRRIFGNVSARFTYDYNPFSRENMGN